MMQEMALETAPEANRGHCSSRFVDRHFCQSVAEEAASWVAPAFSGSFEDRAARPGHEMGIEKAWFDVPIL